MKKDGLWLCNLFVKVLDKQVLNILLYEVITKLIVICFENNIKCSLNVKKHIPMDGIGQCSIETHDIHGYFRMLIVGQWTLGFWDVTLFKSTQLNYFLIFWLFCIKSNLNILEPKSFILNLKYIICNPKLVLKSLKEDPLKVGISLSTFFNHVLTCECPSLIWK